MNFIIESIRDHVGSSAFAKGRDYYIQKKVKNIEINGDTVSGTVQGTEKEPYETEFVVENGEIVDSECSCPVGFECKHVAALALQALMQTALKPAGKPDFSVVSPQKQPKWMQTMKSLLNKRESEEGNLFDLQILFNVEREPEYGYYNFLWRKQGHKESQNPKYMVTMRPRIFDPETGNFSVAQIYWDRTYNYSIYWNNKSGNISQKHFTYLQLLKAGLSEQYSRSWTRIGDGKADYVWQILKQHEAYGVTLLGGTKGQIPLILSDEPLEIKVSIDETSKGLTIEKRIFCSNENITDKQIAFAGNPSGFAVVVDRQKYELHPVSTQSGTAASFDEKIIIPKTDIPILQEKFLPKLTKQYSLETNTEKIKLPETISLNPTITIRWGRKMIIGVKFGFSYKNQTFPFDQIPDVLSVDSLTFIPKKQSAKEMQETLEKLLCSNPAFANLSREVMLEDIDAARFVAETIPKLQAQFLI